MPLHPAIVHVPLGLALAKAYFETPVAAPVPKE